MIGTHSVYPIRIRKVGIPMYTLVLILLGMWAIAVLLYNHLKRSKERRRAEAWVASQPVEVLISERRRAVEKARALLKGQIDCDDFIHEFTSTLHKKLKNDTSKLKLPL